jgi:hypothetical protein
VIKSPYAEWLKADAKWMATISAGGKSLAWLLEVWGYGWGITVHNCTPRLIKNVPVSSRPRQDGTLWHEAPGDFALCVKAEKRGIKIICCFKALTEPTVRYLEG